MTMNDAVEENPEEFSRYLMTWFQAAMIYSVVWGIGGLLNYESREKFDVFHRKVIFLKNKVETNLIIFSLDI